MIADYPTKQLASVKRQHPRWPIQRAADSSGTLPAGDTAAQAMTLTDLELEIRIADRSSRFRLLPGDEAEMPPSQSGMLTGREEP